MKKKWLCRFLGFFAACGATLAGFAGIQRLLLFLAQKKDSPVPFEEQFRSSQGEIACRSMGHGRPLLLVHSMMPGASSAEWEPVLDALAEHYHVYAIDLPGFGHSFRPEKPWTAYQYANLLHEFIQDAVRRPVCAVAANGGADFVLTLSLLFPEDIRRMALISPEGLGRGFATPEDTKPLPFLLSPIAGTQKFLTDTSKGKTRERLENAFFAKEKVTPELTARYSNAARTGAHAQTAFAGIQTRFYAADTRRAFQTIPASVPFLLIWGEGNAENPVSVFHEAEKMQDRGAFLLFEETGVLPHLENSQGFLQNIMDFLK